MEQAERQREAFPHVRVGRLQGPAAGAPVDDAGQRSTDGERDALDDVVPHALVVPWRLERLRVADGVGGSAGELMLARGGVPVERPAAPGEFAEGGCQRRVCQRPSTATSTRAIGTLPDQARPESETRPASTNRRREKKSRIPGGIMSARTRIRETGSPGSSASGWYR